MLQIYSYSWNFVKTQFSSRLTNVLVLLVQINNNLSLVLFKFLHQYKPLYAVQYYNWKKPFNWRRNKFFLVF